MDVYVPSNRDKYGGRYGFVQFIRVVDAVELEKQLQQIWIGTYKVRVHRVRRKEQPNLPPVERSNSRVKATGDLPMARRYADVVSGKGPKPGKVWRPKNPVQSQKVATAGNRWYGIHHTVTDEEMTWLAKCYVGQLPTQTWCLICKKNSFIWVYILSKWFQIPMGGNLVLIKVTEDEDFLELLKNEEGAFQSWFSEIRKWSPVEVPRYCHTWIRCQGVPLHAWDDGFFQKIAAVMGKFVMLDTRTTNKTRSDMTLILIQTTSLEVIHRVMKVKINDQIFSIRVVEEPFMDLATTAFLE